MRNTTTWILLALAMIAAGATSAQAQGPGRYMVLGGPIDYGNQTRYMVLGGPANYGGLAGTPAPDPGVIYPYSYSVTAPLPARAYVPYGDADIFPYYGRPYGHAYDRWSWDNLSGANPLARYYYPPVR